MSSDESCSSKLPTAIAFYESALWTASESAIEFTLVARNVSAGALKPLGSLKSLKLDGGQVQHMVEALKENSNLTSVALRSVDTGSTLPSLSSDLSHISLTTLILQNNQVDILCSAALGVSVSL